MKKEAKKEVHSKTDSNSYGTASVVLGIIGLVFASLPGIILAIIGLVFASKQNARAPNNWSKAGKILGILGIILGILVIIVNVYYFQSMVGDLGGTYALQ